MNRALDDFAPEQLDPYGERFKQGAAPSTPKCVSPNVCVLSVSSPRRLPVQHGFPEYPQLNDMFFNLDDDQWHIYVEHNGCYQWTILAWYPTNGGGPR